MNSDEQSDRQNLLLGKVGFGAEHILHNLVLVRFLLYLNQKHVAVLPCLQRVRRQIKEMIQLKHDGLNSLLNL